MSPILTRDELIERLARAEREVGDFFGSLDAEEVVLRVGDAWTPAEHLDHLNIAIGEIARAFGISAWLLRLRFGSARRPARTFEQVRDDYRARLATGLGARGRFVPTREAPMDEDAIVRRTRLLSRWYAVNAKLSTALAKWSERSLDRVLLPHPILGRIPAREIIMFGIYHNYHHIAAAKTRLPRFRAAT